MYNGVQKSGISCCFVICLLASNVLKRDTCYENVCPSICVSHSCVTPKRFKIKK